MDRLTEKLEAAMAAEERPALKLAAAVREHVIFHGLHTREAFVTDSEIRALRPDAQPPPHRPAGRLPGHLHLGDRGGRPRRLIPGRQPAGRDVLDAPWRAPASRSGSTRTARSSSIDVADLQVELVLSSLGADAELIAEAMR